RRYDTPSSPDALASAQEQTKARRPMPPSSVSSKHADDENSTRGRSSPKPSKTPEGAFRPQCCLLLCRQPDKGEVNDYHAVPLVDSIESVINRIVDYYEAKGGKPVPASEGDESENV